GHVRKSSCRARADNWWRWSGGASYPGKGVPAMPGTQAKENRHDTRRLLDELDALMDQMLALPVGDQDDAVGAPATAATVSATLTMLEPAPDAAAPSVDFPMSATAPVEPLPAPSIGPVAVPTSIELTPLPPAPPRARWP